MMDLATLIHVNRQAARRSANVGKVPLILDQRDIDDMAAGADRMPSGGIPYIGDRAPKGWRHVNLSLWFLDDDRHGVYLEAFGYGAFFVDKSGFGSPGDPALTLQQFAALIRPGFGYGVIEDGQFQCHVGVFERRPSRK